MQYYFNNNRSMREFVVISLISLSFFMSACSGGMPYQSKDKLEVVTSFYPLYEIAEQVGGRNVNVQNMVPAGSEPHDYEPTPSDIVNLNQARLIIYNGKGMEPWADRIIPDLQKSGVK